MSLIDRELEEQCRRVANDTVQMLEQLRVLADRLGRQAVCQDDRNTWIDGYEHAHCMRSIEDAEYALHRLVIRIMPDAEARRMLNIATR